MKEASAGSHLQTCAQRQLCSGCLCSRWVWGTQPSCSERLLFLGPKADRNFCQGSVTHIVIYSFTGEREVKGWNNSHSDALMRRRSQDRNPQRGCEERSLPEIWQIMSLLCLKLPMAPTWFRATAKLLLACMALETWPNYKYPDFVPWRSCSWLYPTSQVGSRTGFCPGCPQVPKDLCLMNSLVFFEPWLKCPPPRRPARTTLFKIVTHPLPLHFSCTALFLPIALVTF